MKWIIFIAATLIMFVSDGVDWDAHPWVWIAAMGILVTAYWLGERK